MCGIAGFITAGSHSLGVEVEQFLDAMGDAVIHRGPDDGGSWSDSQAGVWLGHRRLAIVDLSPAGHQPMQSLGGRYGRHGSYYYLQRILSKLIVSSGLSIDIATGCEGVVIYIANLVKYSFFPVGFRIFRQHWWALMDGILKPIYMLGTGVDALLRFPPSSWVVMARKPE
jgi:hypothetical protein